MSSLPSYRESDILTLPDGRKVHLVTAGPADARPVVVLLHGLGGSSFELVAVIRELAARGRKAVCADRAGSALPPVASLLSARERERAACCDEGADGTT